jgi:signal transduction histidine kinase
VGDKGKPGTGLGLFIARSIAEANGGSLEVRSSSDSGATFRLSLPL